MTGSVHPHVCGEHWSQINVNVAKCGSSPRVWGTWRQSMAGLANRGSSPRVWGTCRQCHSGYAHARFIPTCVGNIPPCLAASIMAAVHPHVCGEHKSSHRKTHRNAGSSPRVWGTYSVWQGVSLDGRFIPTCVGNMGDEHCVSDSGAVHPHVCGEHLRVRLRQVRHHGSSPRVWGTFSY